MRGEGDFAAYAVARWGPLLRTLVLLGAPAERAHRLARSTLARVHLTWADRDSWPDLDAHSFEVLLACKRADDTDWWVERAGDVATVEDRAEAEWRSLEPRLDRLTEPERWMVALCAGGGLSDEQARDVVAWSGPTPLPEVTERLRLVASAVPAERPQVEASVAESAGLRRRRRTRIAAGMVGVTAVLLGGYAVADSTGTSPAAAPASAAPDGREVSPPTAPVPWWANGVLHLGTERLPVAGIRDLATADDGAVYLDDRRRLFHIRSDGSTRRLGTIDGAASFVVSAQDGLVAWVDPDTAELVVVDLTDGLLERVGTRTPRPVLVALDGGTVFYRDGRSTWQHVIGGRTTASRGRMLLDVEAGARVYQNRPARIGVAPQPQPQPMPQPQRPPRDGAFSVPGTGAELSSTGLSVLTRVPGTGARAGLVRVHDTAGGGAFTVGGRDATEVATARLGPGGTVTYIVALDETDPKNRAEVRIGPKRAYELLTCTLEGGQCRFVAQLAASSETPLLAR